ncbi:MAG: right-handed parallel beta-helix repeat-containing protein [Planctomycetes bacterium]|nr:right-handed parallel beta-helix repeat-containing protein [Planctomycetota bacterium]
MKIRTTVALFAALLIASSHSASAADLYVSPTGSDANPGSASAPLRTINKAVNAVSAGGTVWIRGGTYREEITMSRSGTASAPIIVSAYNGEKPVIKGSQVVTGWTQHSGSIYKKTGWIYNSQQVFDDGAPLQQIGIPAAYGNGISVDGTPYITAVGSNLSSMAPGRFWYDRTNKVLYVWLANSSHPANSVMEASTQRRIMTLYATNYVQVKGLAFRHSSTAAFQVGGAGVELGANTTLENCDVQWCDFAGITAGYQKSGDKILNCIVSNNGDSGIGISSSFGFLIRGCTIASNNYRKFNFLWHAGGVKVTTDGYGTLDQNTVRDNKGNGIWFDYADSGNANVISRNQVINNVGDAGIMIEASKSFTVKNNVVSGNGKRGIYIASSDNVGVYDNTLTGNYGVATMCIAGMPRAGKTLTNVSVQGNILSNNSASDDIMLVKENGGDIRAISCDYNLVWRSSGTIAMWWGLDGRGGWKGTRYTSMSAWRSATPFSDHCKQADPQFSSSTSFSLRSTSPALNTGKFLPGVADDMLGVARPQGGVPDMGAYEFR